MNEPLDPRTLEALRYARQIHGRNYKAPIRQAWEDGNYHRQCLEDYSSELQSLRNARWGGPAWLEKFQFPKES